MHSYENYHDLFHISEHNHNALMLLLNYNLAEYLATHVSLNNFTILPM